MFDQQYLDFLPLVISGTSVTVNLALLSLVISSILGMIGALAKISRNKFIYQIGNIYTIAIRGVPDLVLILLIFYGGQIGLNLITEKIGVDYIFLNPFISGGLTIGFIYGAYMTETFRGAILAVDKGQIEAAKSFGLSYLQIWYRIIFPLMVRHALPSYVNNWLVLIKSTALISIIGLEDLIRKSSIAGSVTKKPFAFLFTAALIYIIITSISMLILKIIERKYRAIL